MPIPFLIGGALIAAVAAAVVAVKNSDSDSSSGDDDSAEAEAAARKKAEAKRLKLERNGQLTASLATFAKRGSQFGESIALVLPSELISAKSDAGYKIAFNLESATGQPSKNLFSLVHASTGGGTYGDIFKNLSESSFAGIAASDPSMEQIRRSLSATPELEQITKRLEKVHGNDSPIQTTLSNLAVFAKLYPSQYCAGTALQDSEKQLQRLENDLKRAKKLRKQVNELEAKFAASTGSAEK